MWLRWLIAFDAYEPGLEYWCPKALADAYVAHGYAEPMVPQPKRKITRQYIR